MSDDQKLPQVVSPGEPADGDEKASDILDSIEESLPHIGKFEEMLPGADVVHHLEMALMCLKDNKPNDRSDVDRRFAIVATDLEKVIAYHSHFILRGKV